MGKKCLKCEQVCVWLFLFLPAALVPYVSIAGIIVGSVSLSQASSCEFRPRYNVYYSNYCDRSLFIGCFTFMIALSLCVCQISCCTLYAKMRESYWRKNKLNQPNTQQQNNLALPREQEHFTGLMARTPPPTYSIGNERANLIPTYSQAFF